MNAINDILDNDRWTGTLDSISWLIEVVDKGFVVVISFIAFFIIFGAFSKNVIAGAYASYPKLFDKVHDFKEQGKSKASRMQSKEFGIVASVLLSLIPNFKDITDFKDDTIEPKDYFIKAIPSMFLTIMIGITIYNGYQRDLMIKSGTFASTIFERAMSSVDPVAILDEITNWTSNPVFASKGEDTDVGKATLKISSDIFFDITGYYTDIKPDEAGKSNLAANVEGWVRNTLESLDAEGGYLDTDKYKMSYTVDQEFQYKALENQNYETETLVSRAYSISTVDQFKISSLVHAEDPLYVRLILRFEKKSEGIRTYTFNDLTMVIPIGSYTTGPQQVSGGGQVTSAYFNFTGDAELKIPSSTNRTKFKANQLDYNVYVANNGVSMYSTSVTIDPTRFVDQLLHIGADAGSNNLFYELDGKSYKVTSIMFVTDTSNGIYFTNEAQTVSQFKFGDTPTPKSE